MAGKKLVKDKWDFIVSCRSRKEQLWMQALVLSLKRQWTFEQKLARRR